MREKGLVVLLAVLVGMCVLMPCVLCEQTVSQEEARVPVAPPNSYVAKVSGEEFLAALKRYFPNVRIWGVVDDVYETVSKEEMERFLETDKTDRMFVGRIYTEGEYLDLDDYAFTLLGNMSHDFGWERVPFGIIGRGKRGYNLPEKMPITNIFATREDGRVVLYEIDPRNDKMERITFRQRDVLIALI